MAGYFYSVAIQANSFHNNIMANKMIWQINPGQITEYSLYVCGAHIGNKLLHLLLSVYVNACNPIIVISEGKNTFCLLSYLL